MSIFGLVQKVPLFGMIAYIVNAYVYGGDAKSGEHFAPLRLWVKAFAAEAVIVGVLTVISTGYSFGGYLSMSPDCDVVRAPGDLITSIFPSLIGFGIGVYALIFALSKVVVVGLQDAIKEKQKKEPNPSGSVLTINAEFAYPLLVLILATGLGIIAKLYPNSAGLLVSSWAAFWYGLVMIIEVIHSLFLLGENDLLHKL